MPAFPKAGIHEKEVRKMSKHGKFVIRSYVEKQAVYLQPTSSGMFFGALETAFRWNDRKKELSDADKRLQDIEHDIENHKGDFAPEQTIQICERLRSIRIKRRSVKMLLELCGSMGSIRSPCNPCQTSCPNVMSTGGGRMNPIY